MTHDSVTLAALIEKQARHQPNQTYALGCQSGQAISFGDLARDCRRVVQWLQALGSQPGDVISVVMPNGLQTLRLLLGAMYGGWCVNPVNLLSQQEQMRYVLDHSDCRVVFVSPDFEAARAVAEAGLFKVFVPEEYGGSFVDVLTYGVICEELARVEAPLHRSRGLPGVDDRVRGVAVDDRYLRQVDLFPDRSFDQAGLDQIPRKI